MILLLNYFLLWEKEHTLTIRFLRIKNYSKITKNYLSYTRDVLKLT
nr:MAG TPA: hypothetical protein [Caudoviricetes sp.]